MTDEELVKKKLAFIETCLSDLRRLAKPDRILDDIREKRFVEHTLQLAIQAMVDIALHIVADERLGEPEKNREVFRKLARGGWLASEHVASFESMTGFRNVLVHEYVDVDPFKVKELVEHRLGDFELFIAAIRAKLPKRS